MHIKRALDRYLSPYIASGDFSGAVLLAEGSTVLACAGYGLANYELNVPCSPRTRFHIASVSKAFTALAVLMLEQDGRLHRDDGLGSYVPGLPGGDQVTLTHLLTHTSGIPDINQAPFFNDLARAPQTATSLTDRIRTWLQEMGHLAGPGEYRYSNSNYNLLAAAVEIVSGQAYGAFLRDRVFRPAGMTATSHDSNAAELIPERAAGYTPAGVDSVRNAPYIDWSSKTGSGSLVSTVEDLHRFHCALSSGELIPTGILDAAVRAGSGNRYGWFARTAAHGRSLAANGRSPGFTASLERFEDGDRCVIVLSNRYSTVSQSPIARDLARIFFGEPVDPPVLEHHSVPASELDRFAGTYQSGDDFLTPGVELRVDAAPDHLVLRWGNQELPLVPLGPAAFRDRLFWAQVRFEHGPADETVALIWTYDGRDYRAERVAYV